MLIVQARLAAPAALLALNRVEGWTVLQVHPDACNLGAEPDQLVALVRPEVGPGPFSIVVALPGRSSGFTEFAAAEDRAEVRQGALFLGKLQIRLEGVDAWQPRPAWEALRASGNLPRWLDPLAALLQAQAPAGSLADGLAAILAGDPLDTRKQGDLHAEALRAAVEDGGSLIDSLARMDLTAAGRAAGRLAGLGSGLTPAGDDFLVGAMLALWSSANPSWARRAGKILLEAAAHKTNRISRAWLAAAALGEAAEAWHALVQAVIEDAQTAVHRAGERIIRQGHTSGADALTGYVAAASKTAPGSGAV